MSIPEGLLDRRCPIHLFFSTFTLIFIAELPDKTAFATLMLATRNHPTAVFLGVAAAFVIQCLVAVTFGSVLSLLPQVGVRIGSGILFLVFAIVMWRKKDSDETPEKQGKSKKKTFLSATWGAFLVIFIAEWGDLTQISTAALAAQFILLYYLFRFGSCPLGRYCNCSFAGQGEKHHQPRKNAKIAAVTFALVGLVILGTYRI